MVSSSPRPLYKVNKKRPGAERRNATTVPFPFPRRRCLTGLNPQSTPTPPPLPGGGFNNTSSALSAHHATTTHAPPPPSSETGQEATTKLAEAIDDFLGDLEKKFKGISDEILTKLDDMAERCDRLEQEMLVRETSSNALEGVGAKGPGSQAGPG
ncbi:hypothetical protein A1O7_08629 [Cladophialophora yegresii CBS 114405]|uniref:Heat shock factor binding protein 1 n=1 Tax=Cladophialophora yegresii CBS 114405 TaxID=1182544 RepID=W9VRP0_9EURO|nr:uncharacterized protein A1O7_08629 [Cladophialophora yegresii CBS 114405]EXJ55700.1 hypothetical protein A1O7_08629 [Cladophialophora yegresii CBS 114405]